MDSDNDKDYLKCSSNPNILNKIKSEILLFSDKLIKINRFGVRQQRKILITDLAVYNFKHKSKFISK